jgi:DNA-directed RNA polymerase
MFLAFCIEYKRYHEFLLDENAMEFNTYLPVQLDATCNGFQHLALLSNEDTLFKELNLIVSQDTPNDFYSFLVYKLEQLFDKDPMNESYNRLRDFALERSYIKKAIMTIPYNVSRYSMRKYITEGLHLVEKDLSKDKISWYSKTEKGSKPHISYDDITVLTESIYSIINTDFEKIKRLMKYLRNVATILSVLGLPII